MAEFGLPRLIEAMAANGDLWRMGHGQHQEARDLGLGWLYYGLARSLQPSLVVVIGSWRGFVPMLLGQALQDQGEAGRLIFIDPSLVDDFWRTDVKAYFDRYGLHCIHHYLQTSEQFLAAEHLEPACIDLLFIDGYHSHEQCRFEHRGFQPYLSPNAVTLFHDSASRRQSPLYGAGKEYEHSVWRYIDELRADPGFEVVDLEQAQGVAMVRTLPA